VFGKDKAGGSDAAALQAEFDRLSSLSLLQLAEEIMSKTFPQLDPVADGAMSKEGRYQLARASAEDIARGFAAGPGESDTDPPEDIAKLWAQLMRVIEEGLQQLERALLIGVEGGGRLYYFATRLGQAALERDAVNRVLTGGTL
jgi:hypothetical protein